MLQTIFLCIVIILFVILFFVLGAISLMGQAFGGQYREPGEKATIMLYALIGITFIVCIVIGLIGK